MRTVRIMSLSADGRTTVTEDHHDQQHQPPIPAYDPQAQRPKPAADEALRKKALDRIEEKKAFRIHLTVYAVVNAFLILIWLITGLGYFWPIWPMLGWGLGVALHAFALGWDKEPTEEEIAREAARIRLRERGQGRIED